MSGYSSTNHLLLWHRGWSFFQLVEKAHLQYFCTPPLYVNSHVTPFYWLLLCAIITSSVYSIQLGVGTFLLRYVPRLLRSLLVEIGLSEDMYDPVCKFLISDSFSFSFPNGEIRIYYNNHKAANSPTIVHVMKSIFVLLKT